MPELQGFKVKKQKTGGLFKAVSLGVLLSIAPVFLLPCIASAETALAFSGAIGPRFDTFNWNIAGNTQGQNPNVLSELTWSGISSLEISAGARLEFNKRYFVRARGAYGSIFAGKVRDSDYAGDNRTMEYSRSESDSNSGSLTDLSVAVGFKEGFEITDGRGFVAPFVGFSQHRQRLTITNGRQIVPVVATIAGLNSSYDASWTGPFVGLDFEFTPGTDYDVVAAFEYHLIDYYAEADWNLRQNFAHPKSFTHSAFGSGFIASIGMRHKFAEAAAIFFGFEFKSFSAADGIDRTYLTNGAHFDTRLNGVNWNSILFKAQMDFDL